MSFMRAIQKMFSRGGSVDDTQVIENFKRVRKRNNDLVVSNFDKADWHYDAIKQKGLDEGQMFVPGGLLLGWLVEKEFLSDEMYELYGEEIDDFLNRNIGPADLYQAMDGKLHQDMLTKEGARFMHYYFSAGNYFNDYENTFNARDGAQYSVADSWNNFEKLSNLLDLRLRESG
ncbi:MAG: hypothetical protein IT342_23320 [Candidatus Melainabacteria bacterium]|nr:hypothetical protein [Candidatus Melainabacteria bacterium]